MIIETCDEMKDLPDLVF